MNGIIALVKAIQEKRIKGQLDINKLQESVDFISAKFNEYEEDKKAK